MPAAHLEDRQLPEPGDARDHSGGLRGRRAADEGGAPGRPAGEPERLPAVRGGLPEPVPRLPGQGHPDAARAAPAEGVDPWRQEAERPALGAEHRRRRQRRRPRDGDGRQAAGSHGAQGPRAAEHRAAAPEAQPGAGRGEVAPGGRGRIWHGLHAEGGSSAGELSVGPSRRSCPYSNDGNSNNDDNSNNMDFLRGSSVNIGTTQRRLAWPLRKDSIDNDNNHDNENRPPVPTVPTWIISPASYASGTCCGTDVTACLCRLYIYISISLYMYMYIYIYIYIYIHIHLHSLYMSYLSILQYLFIIMRHHGLIFRELSHLPATVSLKHACIEICG